jgi:predicted component of viral defense system (DUF524 family)
VVVLGPIEGRRGYLIDAESPPGRLRFTSLTDVACRVRLSPDSGLVGQETDEGPRLFEDTPYRFFIEASEGEVTVAHRSPEMAGQFSALPDHPNLLEGTVNFRRQVGISRFNVMVDDEQALAFEIEVFPTKLDYATDYRDLIDDTTRVSRALALEYLRATSQEAAPTPADEATELEWVLLLRSQLQRLVQAMAFINRNPHRVLVRDVRTQPLHRVRRPTSTTLNAIRHGAGSGPWSSIAGFRARSRLPSDVRRETLDTPEHRWIKQGLQSALRNLTHVIQRVQAELQQGEGSGRSTLRVERELAELQGMEKTLERLLRSAFLEDVSGPPPSRFSSLALMSRMGYREAYQALVVLQHGIRVEGTALEVSVTDLDVLFEYWCFLRCVELLRELTSESMDAANLFRISASGVRVVLEKGSASRVRLGFEGQTAEVTYNPAYSGLTGNQRPDIVLRILREGWPPMDIVFDAKYRVDASSEYVRQFGVPGPPADAVNVLHRYRDAILSFPNEKRHAVRGAALFPLNEAMSTHFENRPLRRALTSLGVGALPFLPTNVDHVRKWLRELLDTPSETLAEPGPPFAALEHARSSGD